MRYPGSVFALCGVQSNPAGRRRVFRTLPRAAVLCIAFLSLLAAGGCVLPMTGGKERRRARADGEIKIPVVQESQSLLSIGEQALNAAEDLEDAGRETEARSLYQRAVWAFTYHQQLTGVTPMLVDAAKEGLERTTASPPSSTEEEP